MTKATDKKGNSKKTIATTKSTSKTETTTRSSKSSAAAAAEAAGPTFGVWDILTQKEKNQIKALAEKATNWEENTSSASLGPFVFHQLDPSGKRIGLRYTQTDIGIPVLESLSKNTSIKRKQSAASTTTTVNKKQTENTKADSDEEEEDDLLDNSSDDGESAQKKSKTTGRLKKVQDNKAIGKSLGIFKSAAELEKEKGKGGNKAKPTSSSSSSSSSTSSKRVSGDGKPESEGEPISVVSDTTKPKSVKAGSKAGGPKSGKVSEGEQLSDKEKEKKEATEKRRRSLFESVARARDLPVDKESFEYKVAVAVRAEADRHIPLDFSTVYLPESFLYPKGGPRKETRKLCKGPGCHAGRQSSFCAACSPWDQEGPIDLDEWEYLCPACQTQHTNDICVEIATRMHREEKE